MIKVNLLSPEKKELAGAPGEAPAMEEERESKINTVAAVAAGIITVALIGYMYITQSNTIDEKQRHLQERRARQAQLQNVLKTITELEKTKENLDRKVRLITQLKSQQQDAVKMMDELLNALPDWVWLTSLTFSNRMLTLRGKTLGNNLISDFINNLKGTGSFSDIQFPGSTRRNQGGLDIFEFSLTCIYQEKDKSADKKNI
jgi:type IV pilus assembly protein PilN